jgi:ADP-ribose pyrophosphatase
MTARRQPATEQIIDTQVIYSGKKATLKLHTVDLGDGRTSTREIIEHPGVAAIVPIDAEGNVVFVRQYRLAVGDMMLEIPAGVLDPGESAEEGAQRELREETGLRAGKLTRLGPEFFVSPGISTEWIRLFLAQDLQDAPLDPDEDEDIVTERVPLAEAVRMVERGELRDAKSITGILLAARLLETPVGQGPSPDPSRLGP